MNIQESDVPGRSLTHAGRVLGSLRTVVLSRYGGVGIGLLVVCVYAALTQPVFLTWGNWMNIFRAQSMVLILGIGMTYVILASGIDLSIASMTAASAMAGGIAIYDGMHWGVALAVFIGVGMILGLINGFLIGFAKISFFVVTLGSLSMYQSWALVSSSGETYSLFRFPHFAPIKWIVTAQVGGAPILLVLVIALYFLAWLVLRHFALGRKVYAVGSNREAAGLSGVSVPRVLMAVYVLSGLTAGLAAIVQTGRLTAASPQVDPNMMLNVIAAVLIGGTSFSGGDGGVGGTVLGVVFLGVVQNALSLGDVSTFWQGTVSGAILVAAVGLGVIKQHRWGGLRKRWRARAGRLEGGGQVSEPQQISRTSSTI